MIRNYFKIAWRNLSKNKLFSLINIISLAIGLSASFVIGLMVYYDFTFDKFHPDGDRIYRIVSDFQSPEGISYSHGVAVPLSIAVKEGMTGVKNASSFFTYSPLKVAVGTENRIFKNPEFTIFADKNYFDLFKYTWLAGNKEIALSNPNEVILTEDRAKKYFPNLTPGQILGQVLVYNDSINTKVTGIVESFNQRTDLIFQEFISLPTALHSSIRSTVSNESWNSTNSNSQLFVKLNRNSKTENVQQQLDVLAKKHQDDFLLKLGHTRSFYLQPLGNLHFNTNYGIFDYGHNAADKSVLLSLGSIALFLLILGCINFINLNTAQATQRAKEIGIRKTLGSSKKQLIFQFLGETTLLTFLAGLLSLVLAFWLIEIFSDFIPAGLNFDLFATPAIIAFIVILLILVTLLAGFYPALVLSHFKPVSVLKSHVVPGNQKSSLRKSLTVFQFVIAQIFIIATILVGKQIQFMMTEDMGFKTEAIAYIRTPWHEESMDKRLRFMEEMKNLPQVKNISIGGPPPASFYRNSTIATYYNGKKEIQTDLNYIHGDTNYLNLYDIKILAGRNLRNDTVREFIVNETLLEKLGFNYPQEAIGEVLKINKKSYPIVGVMEDFHHGSLKSDIEPMALQGDWYRGKWSNFTVIHILLKNQKEGTWPTVISTAEDVWQDIYPGSDFELKFIDETVQQFYVSEQKLSKLLSWATGLSVLISCLGLLGLVIYTTERRTKEIAIRKILGASLSQLNLLLCKDFMILVGLAFLIAAPIAWWGISNWLQDFAYRTELSWWIFPLSGICMLSLAIFIMSSRTLITAMKNPVKSLRTE